ncbi:MAG: Hypothetical protein BHV28_09830 [Candidatus Tokpelaia hoelldobleri]|uniref:Uncharacterized protein n=1 Tax=Candidatus Tokpelaia hoelldobleri TaxID=1902579 RepID=A0A1U9JV00_9HYPH|nr:MAG: Hypothetical protein BHV28_09830 [Candidatus Tokpelaia hoelldoblerii]
MKMIIAGLLSCSLLTGAGAQTRAEDSARTEKVTASQLVQLVADMNKAMHNHDAAFVVNNMPARLYQEMARRLQKSESELRADVQKSVNALFEHLVDNGYTLDSANIRYEQTEEGAFYALVPTHVETKDSIAEFMTLALYDGETWHLIYGGQKAVQNPVFQEIYPALVSVHLPLGKVMRK